MDDTKPRKRWVIAASILIALLVIDIATSVFSNQIDNLVRFRALQLAHQPDELWDNSFFGVPMHQFPADFVEYQNVIWEQKPDVIVETGTYRGGNAIFLAAILSIVNPAGKIVTIDIVDEPWKETLAKHDIPQHLLDRITFIKGDSVGDETLARVRELTRGKKTLVVLDALHERQHVLKELELYSPLIPVGGYIVVNDGQLEWAMWMEFWNEGPATARKEFLESTDAYVLDEFRPRHFIANTRGGFVKRVK